MFTYVLCARQCDAIGNVLVRSIALAINRTIAWLNNNTSLRNHYRGVKLFTIWHLCLKFIMSPMCAPLSCPHLYHCNSIMYLLHVCRFFHVSLCLVCYVNAVFFSSRRFVASVAVIFDYFGACICGPENGPTVLCLLYGVPVDGPGIGTIFLDCFVFLRFIFVGAEWCGLCFSRY